MHGAVKIHPHHPLEVRRVHRFDIVRYQDAGRVHEDIDRAEGLERVIHGPADFGGMGHVRAQRERPCSGRFDLPLKLIQECLAPGQHRDLRAHAAEAHRDVASDAAGSAGYQDGSIAKIAGAQHFRPVYSLGHDPPFWRGGLALPLPWDGEKNRRKSVVIVVLTVVMFRLLDELDVGSRLRANNCTALESW